MSHEVRRLTTEEERERLYAARRSGGLCSACGRVLSQDEPVYIERFVVGTRRLLGTDMSSYELHAWAPVGAECASSAFLAQMYGRDPERCAGCGRGVYYRLTRSKRHRAHCSRRCSRRTQTTRRSRANV